MAVLITGASSGIGYEFAKVFAKNGHDVILVARRKERLLKLKANLEKYHKIKATVIVADLSKKQTPQKIYNQLKKSKINVDILINNAGIGTLGKFWESDLKKELDLIEVNITSLTTLTNLFLKDMIKTDKGIIMNLASVVSFMPGPFMASYCASKAYVLSFTESIANEVKDTNVKVMALCPGSTKTEFIKVIGGNDSSYAKTVGMANPKDVAEYGYKKIKSPQVVHIHGFMNRFIPIFMRLFPRQFIADLMRKIQESKLK